MELSISNVININVSQPGQGVGQYNTSNEAIFTEEVPAVSFGSLGYKLYLSPTEVAQDFGSASKTAKMANAIFSQQPNLLASNGYLAVILMNSEVQELSFDDTPVTGTFVINYGLLASAAVNFDDTAAEIQAKLRAIAGLEKVVVTGDIPTGLQVDFQGVYGPQDLLTISANSLETASPGPVTVTVAMTSPGETYDEAITRTVGLVQYFALMASMILSETDLLAAAAVVQPLNKVALAVSRTQADVAPGGKLDLLRSGSFTKTRGLYYGGASDIDALVMMASYAGRAFSTNFNGSNTTQTMHLKDLIGVQPDPSMNQTLLNQCQDAGADAYVSIQGVAKTFCSGANDFFDNVYNLEWFVGAMQVAYFNVLAQTSTKIAQTEQGVDSLKSAIRTVCEQAISNQFLAPGSWTSPNIFGSQEDLIANIAQRGYYIYSSPVAKQLVAERESRTAPLIQVAAKYAGAIHKGNVIININK